MDLNTRIIDLTVSDLENIIYRTVEQAIQNIVPDKSHKEEKSIVGLKGIAKLLGCSPKHAGFLKSEGVFEGAILHVGRSIKVKDVDKLIKNVEKYYKGRK